MSEMKCKRCGTDESRIDGFCSIECRDAFDYEEEIADLEARAEKAEAMVEKLIEAGRIRWIPVSERMPEDGEHVLAAYVDTMLTAAYYRHHIAFGGVDNWWDIGEGWHTGNPTHWMPLPEVPEERE